MSEVKPDELKKQLAENDALPVPISLTTAQWREIYYALDTKIDMIKTGQLGPELKRGDDKRWVNDMADIMDEIECTVDI